VSDYIIRFEGETDREWFRRAAELASGLESVELHFAEALPDVVALEVDAKALEQLKRLAGERARFLEDFTHDLFA
jgi:hypothetical protein